LALAVWPRREKGATVGRPCPKTCATEASSESKGRKIATKEQKHHLVEKRSLVELGWLWKRLAEVGAARCTVLQTAEAGENSQLSRNNKAMLRRKAPLLQNFWLSAKIIDNVDGLERKTVVSLHILFLLAGHEAKK
jgi:hypothetical protein